MTLKSTLLSLCCLLLSGTACVKKKLYKSELTQRQQCEARESVLNRELADRKNESRQLVDRIEELSKTTGRQESEMAELRAKIVALSNTSSQTNARLTEEKAALTTSLQSAQKQMDEMSANLKEIQDTKAAQNARLNVLKNQLDTALVQANVTAQVADDRVELLLPDLLLFENNGVSLSKNGRIALESLAEVLSRRPSVAVEIVAYTDNKLPKNAKNISDTWDWSLQRATTLVRTLVTDLGINANQLTPVGKGEFYPLASNETSEGRAQNRRTVFVFKL
jgi:chemotaxis protein MotB